MSVFHKEGVASASWRTGSSQNLPATDSETWNHDQRDSRQKEAGELLGDLEGGTKGNGYPRQGAT